MWQITSDIQGDHHPNIGFFAIEHVANARALNRAINARDTPFMIVTFRPSIVRIFGAVIFHGLLQQRVTVMVRGQLIFYMIIVRATNGFNVWRRVFDRGQDRFHLPLGR